MLCDWWALGAVMHQTLCGDIFYAPTIHGIAGHVVEALKMTPKECKDLKYNVPEEFLAKIADKRPRLIIRNHLAAKLLKSVPWERVAPSQLQSAV